MLLKVLLGICVVIFWIVLPLYDKAYWPEPTKKSLTYKMTCATLFVAMGVLGVFITGNTSQYAKTMVIGLIFGWIGDLLMHIPNKKGVALLYIGTVAFLVGHIFYVSAFIKSTALLTGNKTLFTLYEIIAIIVLMLIFAPMIEPVLKFKFISKFMQIGVYIYGLFLMTMLVKALSFGITYFRFGESNNLIATIILVLGGISFFISDLTLGMRILGGRKDSTAIKHTTVFTYFTAQFLLANSILFINV